MPTINWVVWRQLCCADSSPGRMVLSTSTATSQTRLATACTRAVTKFKIFTYFQATAHPRCHYPLQSAPLSERPLHRRRPRHPLVPDRKLARFALRPNAVFLCSIIGPLRRLRKTVYIWRFISSGPYLGLPIIELTATIWQTACPPPLPPRVHSTIVEDICWILGIFACSSVHGEKQIVGLIKTHDDTGSKLLSVGFE